MSARPPLLCLHGFLGAADDADWLGPPDGYARIAPDLPGHGPSPDLTPLGTDPAQSFERCIAWIESQVETGGGAIDVLGYSMGGRLAFGLLARRNVPIRHAVIIGAHPGIAQAAVVGVPDERMGEVAHAFVVPTTGHDLDPAEVVSWARDNMANYKAPRTVEVVDELPLNASGKVLRYELRSRATGS